MQYRYQSNASSWEPENGWEPAVYMSYMGQKFRLFLVSNLSVLNFRFFSAHVSGVSDWRWCVSTERIKPAPPPKPVQLLAADSRPIYRGSGTRIGIIFCLFIYYILFIVKIRLFSVIFSCWLYYYLFICFNPHYDQKKRFKNRIYRYFEDYHDNKKLLMKPSAHIFRQTLREVQIQNTTICQCFLL